MKTVHEAQWKTLKNYLEDLERLLDKDEKSSSQKHVVKLIAEKMEDIELDYK